MFHSFCRRSRVNGINRVCTRDDSCKTVDQIKEFIMTINVDNKGAKDLVKNWIIGGRTRHSGVRLNHLRKLKEDGIIQSSEENVSDILKKNYRPFFSKIRKVTWSQTFEFKEENAPGKAVKDKG
jgi:hypothetical protein